jgi:adenylate cyclase class 2
VAIEVELKARVPDPDTVRAALWARTNGEMSTYRDTYYDWPDRRLTRAGRQELRVRVIETDHGARCVLTFKGAMLDESSTPEYETEVSSPAAVDAILSALGLEHVIAYTKRCENFRFQAHGYPIVATLVRVPELDGAFVEIETLIPDGAPAGEADKAIRGTLVDLGLGEHDLEPAFYIDMITAGRTINRGPEPHEQADTAPAG